MGLKRVERCCLSFVMLGCISPLKRFPPKTGNEKKSLSTQSLTFTLTENQWTLLKLTNTIKKKKKMNSTFTTKTKTNKYTRRLRYTWRTLLKLNIIVSKNKHTTNKDKSKQIHSHNKIHLNSINKIGKYKKLNMTEHKNWKSD